MVLDTNNSMQYLLNDPLSSTTHNGSQFNILSDLNQNQLTSYNETRMNSTTRYERMTNDANLNNSRHGFAILGRDGNDSRDPADNTQHPHSRQNTSLNINLA